MSSVAHGSTQTWLDEESPNGSTGANGDAYSSVVLIPGSERERRLLQRLADRTTNEHGLDWRALLGLSERWGIRDD